VSNPWSRKSLHQAAHAHVLAPGRSVRFGRACDLRFPGFGRLRKHCADGEANPFASRNGNLVAPTDGFDIAQAPGAKAHEAHLFLLAYFLAHYFGEGVNNLIRILEIGAGPGRNLVNQIILATMVALFSTFAIKSCIPFHVARTTRWCLRE